MIRLSWRLSGLLARRWLRGWGYRGRRPGLALVVVTAVAAGASVLLAAWIHGQLAGLVQGSASLAAALAAVVVVLQFGVAGSTLLLAESHRGSGWRLQTVLGCLPLTGREITALISLPTLGLTVALLALSWVPGITAMSALGLSPYQSAAGSLLALLSGCCLALLVVAAVRTALARGTWAVVQHPLMLLGWMGLVAVEAWRVGATGAPVALSPADHALLLPWLLRAMLERPIAPAQAVVVAVAMAAAAGLLAISGGLPSEPRRSRVLWEWSRRWPAPLVTLDLTRLLRSRHLVANLIGAEVIALGLAAAVWRLPPSLRPLVGGPLVAVMAASSSLPLLTIRRLTRGRTPIPLVLGYGPVTWTASQIAAGLCLALATAVPGSLALAWLGTPVVTIAGWGLAALVAGCGAAIAIGWSAGTTADNPLGQVAEAFLLVLTLGGIGVIAGRAFTAGTIGWTVALVVTGVSGFVWAAVLERERWRRQVGRGTGDG